ncbi:hypothetical protein HY405_01715 [Candidatus Microgenomates bacterium]|nr:hypothetical protein [Candidatus Microgenomates bacterium]
MLNYLSFFVPITKAAAPDPTIEQQITLVDRLYEVATTSYSPADNSLGLIRWDGTKYSGETVYFEAMIAGRGTDSDAKAALFDSSGNQVSGSEVTKVNGGFSLARSSAITLSDNTDYTVRLKGSSGNAVAYMRLARLVIVQTNTTPWGITDSQTQIEIGDDEVSVVTSATQQTDKKIYQYDSSKFSPAPTVNYEATIASGANALEQQINIIDQVFTTTSCTAVPTDNSLGLIRWDGSKYNNETVYFEVVIAGNGTESDANAALYTSSGTIVSGSTVTKINGGYAVKRSNAITLSDNTDYTVRIDGDFGSCTALIKFARLIVVQSNSSGITDTQTQVEVGNNETSTATSDTQLTDKKIYRYTSGAFSPSPTVYFEATLSNDTADQTAYASLYTNGASCSSQVTSSEVSVTGTTWTRVRSSAITLVDGTDYMVCVRASANTARIANAKIVLDQSDVSGIVAVETIQQSANTLATDTDDSYTGQTYDNSFVDSRFPGVTSYYFEATIKTSAGTGYAKLTNDSSAADVDSSEVTTTSTSYTRARSSALTDTDLLQDGGYMDTYLKNSAASGNTTSVANSWLVIQVSGMQPATATADLYNLTDATQVTSSEVTRTSANPTRSRSGSLTLTTAKDYVVRIKSSSANSAVTISLAKIILTQTNSSGITALEVIQHAIHTLRTDTDSTYTDQDINFTFDPANFAAGTFTSYFEATIKTSAGTGYAILENDTDSTTITDAAVAGGTGSGGGLGGGVGGTYGGATLSTLFHGSGGGSGGAGASGDATASNGGGIIYINADTVTLSGTGSISSDSSSVTSCNAGSGSGGSVLIKGNTVTLGNSLVSAVAGAAGGVCGNSNRGSGGQGSPGRIRVEYNSTFSGSTRPTASSTSGSPSVGDGADGAVTISTSKNINADTIVGGRSYADGIAYRVIAPADSATSVSRYSGSDTLSNGIAAGDDVLLINLQGTSSDNADVGNYEIMTVDSVSASSITFTAAITKSYDGTTASNQSVVVQRVPNYTDVTLSSSGALSASSWEGLTTTPTGAAGYLTGIVVFKASGTLSVGTGTSISVSSDGYRGGPEKTSCTYSNQGESYGGGYNTEGNSANGGGGGGGQVENCPNSSFWAGGGGGGAYATGNSSEVSTTSTSYTRVRSSDISGALPTSSKTMDTQLKNSSTNTTSVSNAWLIIQVSALEVPENLLLLIPLAIFAPYLMRWYQGKRGRKQAFSEERPAYSLLRSRP